MRISKRLVALAIGATALVVVSIVGHELLFPKPKVMTQELHDECNRKFNEFVKATKDFAVKLRILAKADKRYAHYEYYADSLMYDPPPGDPCKPVGTVLD